MLNIWEDTCATMHVHVYIVGWCVHKCAHSRICACTCKGLWLTGSSWVLKSPVLFCVKGNSVTCIAASRFLLFMKSHGRTLNYEGKFMSFLSFLLSPVKQVLALILVVWYSQVRNRLAGSIISILKTFYPGNSWSRLFISLGQKLFGEKLLISENYEKFSSTLK